MLEMKKKYKILLVDDSRFNRLVMTSMLAKDYLLEEACDGKEAVLILQDRAEEFSLVLLDIVMPNMDGFSFLKVMRESGWLDFLPVIMISSEYTPENIETSYQLGASDLIQRPYDERVVCHRIANTIALFSKQRDLSNALMDEVLQENESSSAMVSILSHIVETRNGESGAHVQNIRAITGMLLEKLQKVTDRYPLSKEEEMLIVTASSLHDIGKMSVPEEILNKPGRLTDEEFRIIKGHSMAGADMVEPLLQSENANPLIRMTYEICRWHHERYDGRGYPDGLKGDEIPIAAQVVSVADVYDALTSVRCYKPAHPPEKALQMILEGQCGAFNPILMDCLSGIFDQLRGEAAEETPAAGDTVSDRLFLAGVLEHSRERGLFSSDKIMQTLARERLRSKFFFNEPCAAFRYSVQPPVLHLNKAARELLGVEEAILSPDQTLASREGFQTGTAARLRRKLSSASNEYPLVKEELAVRGRDGTERPYLCVMQTLWDSADTQRYGEVVGRLIPLEGGAGGPEAGHVDLESFLPVDGNLTGRGAWYLINALKFMVYNVRLVDPSDRSVVELDSSGTLSKSAHACYEVWRQDDRCVNCTSLKCQMFQKEFAKIVFCDNEVFYVVSQFVKVDGVPLVLELLTRITDDVLVDGSGHHLAGHSISELNSSLSRDSLTNVYNRRYFNARAQGPEQVDGLAVFSVDHFGKLGDTCGRAAEDAILVAVAESVRESLRQGESLVRYDGDTFVLLCESVSEEDFRSRLRRMVKDLADLTIEGLEENGGRITVSMGGAYGPAVPETLLKRADDLLHKAKKARNTVEF